VGKNIARAAVVVLLLVGLLWGPAIVWKLLPTRTLSVVIVDKTVPFRNYREHSALNWLLHAMKVKSPQGRFMIEGRDYVGFDPVKKEGHDLTAAHLAKADVLFISDTYGVYQGDYQTPDETAALERSTKIYGGLTVAEAQVIDDYVASGGLVIAEFNTFASPTEEPARAKLEATFGVKWTKWVGRYWPDLKDAREVPRWVTRVYERVYKKPFELEGPGFVLVREDADMVVLVPGVDVDDAIISMDRTREGIDLGGLPEKSRYLYWMDILACEDCDTLYEHTFQVTPRGREVLKAHDLPIHFPAMTRKKGTLAYYFAGDFIDNTADRGDPERAGLLWWRRVTLGQHDSMDESFFWGWYAPIFQRLVATRLR
jgi:hypothetical protein